MRLNGLPVDGSSGGGAQALLASFAGGDTQQDGLAAVASSVAASGGEAPYTYAATLSDPRGADRSAILTSGTSASPGFTPDQAPGGGQWVLRSTVTDAGGQTATAVKVVTVGQNVGEGAPFIQVLDIESDETTDASVAASEIVWGGVTFGAPNTGVEVVDGDLVLTPLLGSVDLGRGAVGTRTAPLVTVDLAGIGAPAALGDRQILVIVDVESYAPNTTNEALRVGLEQASAGIGTGASGRGVAGGHSYSTNLRAGSVLRADGGGTGDDNSTATAASIAGVACLFAGGAVIVRTATTAYADATAAIAGTVYARGGMRASATPATLDRLVIAAAKPIAGLGSSVVLRRLQVWVR